MMTAFVDDDNDDETARWCVVGPLRWALTTTAGMARGGGCSGNVGLSFNIIEISFVVSSSIID